MKRIAVIILGIAAIAALHGPSPAAAGKNVTLHHFESPVCPVCAQARTDLPAIKSQFPGLTVVTYQTRNAQGKIDAATQKNVDTLLAMLRAIEARAKGKPVVVRERKEHRLVVVGGVPYYEKVLSAQTVIKRELGVPLFIIGDRIVAGYGRTDLERELRAAFGK